MTISYFRSAGLATILTVVATALIAIGGVFLSRLTLGEFGLIGGLSPVYYAGIVLLTLAALIVWTNRNPCDMLGLLQVTVLLVALWMVPLVVGAYPLSGPSELDFQSFSGAITAMGHLNPTGDFWQQNWPGMWILGSVFEQMLSIQHSVPAAVFIEKYLPIFWQILYSLSIFPLISYVLSDNRKWGVIWLFLLGNWVGLSKFDIQSLAALYLFLIFSTILSSKSSKIWYLVIILTAALVVDHPYTGILAIVTLLVLGKGRKNNFVVFSILVFLAWQLFGAIPYWSSQLASKIAQLFNYSSLFQEAIVVRVTSTSFAHSLNTRLGLLFGGLLLFIVMLSYLKCRNDRFFNAETVRMMILVVIIVGISGAFIGPAFGFEFIERIYFLLLPILAIITMIGFGLRSKIILSLVIALLLVGIPTNIFNMYGPEAGNYTSQSFIAGNVFFGGFTTHGYYSEFITTFTKNPANYTGIDLNQACYCDMSQPPIGRVYPYFISMNSLDSGYYVYMLGNDNTFTNITQNLMTDARVSLVYSNPQFLFFASLVTG